MFKAVCEQRGVSHRHQALLLALAEGRTLSEAARDLGWHSKQAADWAARSAAKRLGIRGSVQAALEAVSGEPARRVFSPDLLGISTTAEEMRESDMRAAYIRAKAPLTADEQLCRELERLADALLQEVSQ